MIHSIGVRKHYQYFFLLVLTLIATSCSEDIALTEPEPEPEKIDLEGIFIAGTAIGQGSGGAATYWHDGTPVTLAATHPSAQVYNSVGYGMTVSGSDIYVCGVLWTSQGSFAVYWKNGSPVIVGPANSRAGCITVVDDDVYVSGDIADGSGYSYGVVWKNGIISYLTEGAIHSSATTVLVSGGDVFVGGNIVQDDKTYAAYWKNGTPHLLTSGESFSFVQSLALVGETLYATGTELGSEIGKYWVNDQVVNLTDGSSDVRVNAIHITGTDVYVAGKRKAGTSWELLVWKNNNIILTTPTTAKDIEISGIALESNDLLVTGSMVYVDENSTAHSDATLWTNGVPATLSKGSDGINTYFASSIAVK